MYPLPLLAIPQLKAYTISLKAAVPPAKMSSGTNNTIAGCHDIDNVPLVSLASEMGRVTHQFMH